MAFAVLRTREHVVDMERMLDFWGPPDVAAPGWYLLGDGAAMRAKGIHVIGDVECCSRFVVPVRWQALQKVREGNQWEKAPGVLLHMLYSELGSRGAVELSFAGTNDRGGV